MQIIPQTTHQMESISKKTSLFFRECKIVCVKGLYKSTLVLAY